MNMTAIAIVAIICWCIVELRNSSVKKSKNNAMDKSQKEEFERQISAMSERIETLERIVTDEKYQLRKEFESLRRDSVA